MTQRYKYKWRNLWRILFVRFWHDLIGHPKDQCKVYDALAVECKCGAFITLSDYY